MLASWADSNLPTSSYKFKSPSLNQLVEVFCIFCFLFQMANLTSSTLGNLDLRLDLYQVVGCIRKRKFPALRRQNYTKMGLSKCFIGFLDKTFSYLMSKLGYLIVIIWIEKNNCNSQIVSRQYRHLVWTVDYWSPFLSSRHTHWVHCGPI